MGTYVIQCGIIHHNSYFVQLNDTEEVALANYYKLETTSRMRKNGIRTALIEYYIDNCKYKDKGLCLYIQGNYITIVI